jgi:tetratricopeptide (TPR) repeat protein
MFDLARTNLLAALKELPAEDLELRSHTLLWLAFAEMKAGRLLDSLARLNEASEIVALTGPSNTDFFHTEMSTTLGELAIAEHSDEYFDKACEHYKQALLRSEAVGHHRRTAVLESNHGHLLLAFRRLQEAEFPLVRARKLFDHFSDRCPQLDETLARFHLEVGRLDVAKEVIIRSVATLETGGEEAVLAESLRTHGRILGKLGRHRAAKRVLDRAYQVAERCGDSEGAGLALLIVMEELSEQLQEDERMEMATTLRRLLGQSQRTSVLERLGNCLE